MIDFSAVFTRFLPVFGEFSAVFTRFLPVFGAFSVVFPHFFIVFKDFLTGNGLFRGLALQKLT